MKNPPAFPPMHDPNTHEFGMTLRDYFAAKVLQAYLSMPETATAISTNKTTSQDVCGACYAWADAMLKAREA
jgi:hypothetical protein